MATIISFAEKHELRQLARLHEETRREAEAAARRAEIAERMDRFYSDEPPAPTLLGGDYGGDHEDRW